MSERDCIEDSIARGEIYREQIISNCGGAIPKSTLYKWLSPSEGDRNLCKILVMTKDKIETEVAGAGGTKEYDDIIRRREAYLVRGRALDSAFARKSPVSSSVSFELLKTGDEYATYYVVRVRSSKTLENCTASVMPITGMIKCDSVDEYHTLWQSRANGTTIDLNAGEPADAYLVAMLDKDSTLDHIESLKRNLAHTDNDITRDHVEKRIIQYTKSWLATRPPCYIVGQEVSSSPKMKMGKQDLPVPLSYQLPPAFPHVLVFTVYSSKGFAWVPFLLEGEPRNSIMPRLISGYQSRGGPHWSSDKIKKRTRNDQE